MLLDVPSGGDLFSSMLKLLVPLHLLTFVILIALGVFYVYDLFNNDRIPPDKPYGP
jgi:hypothetical protein